LARTRFQRARLRGVNCTVDIETLSNEWIAAETVQLQKSEDHQKEGELHWAIEYVMNLSFDDKYAELWEFIKCTYPKDLPNNVEELFAAGPIEDFLAGAGEECFDEVSSLSRRDSKFKGMLGGVWQERSLGRAKGARPF